MEILFDIIGIIFVALGVFLMAKIFPLIWEINTSKRTILLTSAKASFGFFTTITGILLLIGKSNLPDIKFDFLNTIKEFPNLIFFLVLCVIPPLAILTLLIFFNIDGTQENNKFFTKLLEKMNKNKQE